MLTVFELTALQALASPTEAITDADRWSDHVRVVTAGPQFALTAFKQANEISQRFDPEWKSDRAAALAGIPASTTAERYLLIGAGAADQALAAEHGWDYRSIDNAAAEAGWDLAGPDDPETTGDLVDVAIATEAAAGVAEGLSTDLADLLTARRGLSGTRAEPLVLREYLTAVEDARATLAELAAVADELTTLTEEAEPPESVADGAADLVAALRTLISRGRAFLEAATVVVESDDRQQPISEAVVRGLDPEGDVELVIDASGLDRAGRAFAEQLEAVDSRADELGLALEPELDGALGGDANDPEPG